MSKLRKSPWLFVLIAVLVMTASGGRLVISHFAAGDGKVEVGVDDGAVMMKAMPPEEGAGPLFEVLRSDAPEGPWSFLEEVESEPGRVRYLRSYRESPMPDRRFYRVQEYVDSDGDGLSDWAEEHLWHTDPSVYDSDGDGLSDGYEVKCGFDPVGHADGEEDADGDGLSNAQECMYGTNPFSVDTDGDGLPDNWEVDNMFDPLDASDGEADADGDGVTNAEEYAAGMNMFDADSDGDGISDWDEILNGLNPVNFEDAWMDDDHDGLANIEEVGYGTDPHNPDTDNDGLDDLWEVTYSPVLHPENCVYIRSDITQWQYISPVDQHDAILDSDEDYLSDYDEYRYGTNPYNPDTDGDGIPDAFEICSMMDPTDATGDNGADGDFDHDGLPNLTEYLMGLDPSFPDQDRDGVPDGDEIYYGTDPWKADSDDDGIGDFDEIFVYHTDPLVADSDGDGLTDYEEVFVSFSDPNSADSDGDGLDDRQEYLCGCNPNSEDSDGDGLPDLWEVRNRTNPVGDDRYIDDDGDGLDTATEFLIGTRADEPDTDGDGMNDGWEFRVYQSLNANMSPFLALGPLDPFAPMRAGMYGELPFDPTVDNSTNSTKGDDLHADPDGDGVDNYLECLLNLDPLNVDTDGDGLGDGEEYYTRWSDPGDSSDDGEWRSYTPVFFGFGSPLASPPHRKYLMTVEPVEYIGDDEPTSEPKTITVLSPFYGGHTATNLMLKKLWRYRMKYQEVSASSTPEAPLGMHPWLYRVAAISNTFVQVSRIEGEKSGSDDEVFDPLQGTGGWELCIDVDDPHIDAMLVPDYDGDGMIGGGDIEEARQGEPFRFWVNDDDDRRLFGKGEIAGSWFCDADDIPNSGPDCSYGEVCGYRDFVDYTPLLLHMDKKSLQYYLKYRDDVRIQISCSSQLLKGMYTGLKATKANSFQYKLCDTCGPEMNEEMTYAPVFPIDGNPIQLPKAFVESAVTDGGVMLVEGSAKGAAYLNVTVLINSVVVGGGVLPISISEVEEMYNWIGLRHSAPSEAKANRDDLVSGITGKEVPPNNPRCTLTGKDYFFVHGFNVGLMDARAWGAEMFKRLWQAGMRDRFWVVDWCGSDHIWGGECLDYWGNVRNALKSAGAMATALEKVKGKRTILAHSLGNVITCEAAARYGMKYEKYYMLNGAIAQECFDEQLPDVEEMIDKGWRGWPKEMYTGYWYRNPRFEDDDLRKNYRWRGRYGGLKNIVNCFSSTEEVVSMTDRGWLDFGWWKQEMLKGSSVVSAVGINGIMREGGWDARSRAGEVANLSGDEFDRCMITDPPFLKFGNAALHSLNAPIQCDDEYRILADGIAATTRAMGMGPIAGGAGIENYNQPGRLEEDAAESWPRGTKADEWGNELPYWKHSDIKNVALFYMYPLFRTFVSGD